MVAIVLSNPIDMLRLRAGQVLEIKRLTRAVLDLAASSPCDHAALVASIKVCHHLLVQRTCSGTPT
jgi:hypothetical protein